jgi:uncharacterized membrane protein (DUF485 family)
MGKFCKWMGGDRASHARNESFPPECERPPRAARDPDYSLARRDKFANDTRWVTSDTERVTQNHRRDERDTPLSNSQTERIRQDPLFAQLCQSRSRLAWTLSALVLGIYLAFILLVAFGGDFMAAPLVTGGVTTVGIVVGIAVILTAILLTAVYVWKANTTFDDLTRRLLERSR